ncbi:hypothetical protein FHY35_004054 [Xanthomonas arboricola]|uniref:hypothetical protein n=1 Tax=Xanthomonas arboricola TaxID=56448 RepID=UPI00141B523D|nr:hypothetical protein [Xanthomonas arboricola]NIJ87004.1 hypothetical protein [Xanthomonas arboricola]
MAALSLFSGLVRSGENDLIVARDAVLPPARGVIYVHGAEGAPPGGLAWTGLRGRWPIMQAVSRRSTIISSDLGGNATWGNSTVVDAIGQARNVLLAQPGVAQHPVGLLCQSMGAGGGVAWAAANRSLVSRIVLLIPALNTDDIRANSGYAADINAAYGGTYSEERDGPTHNPLTIAKAGKLAGLPIQLWYGDSDTLCKPEFALQFAAAVGSTCELRKMYGGHAEETVYNIDPEAVAAFLAGGA